jgi:hypothetical protein
MFKLTGKIRGTEIAVIWDAGHLHGHEGAIFMLTAWAPHETVSMPGGPYWSGSDILASDLATYLLAYKLFDDVIITEGEVTQAPSVPEGAIP